MFELVIGALVTVIVQILKKTIKRLGADWTILLVFVLCFVGAALFNWGKSVVTQEMLKTFATILGTQYVVWGLFVKYIWPRLKIDTTTIE